jgi:DNA-binding beta-propeller fold protein YncE
LSLKGRCDTILLLMRSLVLAVAIVLSSLASAQVLDFRTFSTDGHPTQAIWTPDGQHVLVTVTRHQPPVESGIEVFRVDGAKLKRVAYQPLGNAAAQGIVLIPNTGLLAVGLSNAGIAFLPLNATLEGKATPRAITQGNRSGSSYLAVTPSGDTLFVANEYLNGGSVGVIALRRDTQGEITPVTTAQLRTQFATPGITLSPDGTRLYAVDETLPKNWPERLPGHDIPELQHEGCAQGIGIPAIQNGGLFVIDTAKAAALPADFTPEQEREATRQLMNAGCSPVREAVSSDGHTVYIAARGDNKVLAFAAVALEHDPAHAFLRAIPSGGEAPVGLALFDHDRKLLVANSNRFTNGPGNAAVVDFADPAKPTIVQTIKTGKFPRNITASSDGHRLLLTIFLDDELMLLTMR